MGIPRGSLTSGVLQVIVVFINSAILHGFCDLAAGKEVFQFESSLTFFSIQSIALIAESLAMHLFAGIVSPRLGKVLGYGWVFVWLSWTTPWLAKDCLGAGEALPFSPSNYLLRLAGISA